MLHDPLRLTVALHQLGMSGFQAAEELDGRHNIAVELANHKVGPGTMLGREHPYSGGAGWSAQQCSGVVQCICSFLGVCMMLGRHGCCNCRHTCTRPKVAYTVHCLPLAAPLAMGKKVTGGVHGQPCLISAPSCMNPIRNTLSMQVVVCALGPGSTQQDAHALVAGFKHLTAHARQGSGTESQGGSALDVALAIPVMGMTPRDAFFASSEQCVGHGGSFLNCV